MSHTFIVSEKEITQRFLKKPPEKKHFLEFLTQYEPRLKTTFLMKILIMGIV
jgi:hypothetical protein